jgi:hypothetical protein
LELPARLRIIPHVREDGHVQIAVRRSVPRAREPNTRREEIPGTGAALRVISSSRVPMITS